jgi:type I restriction enzyme, S subunit
MQNRIHEKATGATASGIKASLLRKIQIPTPELSEQTEVVKRLESLEQHCNNLEKIHLEKLTSLNELKQALLQKAFSGELTAERAEREVESATC